MTTERDESGLIRSWLDETYEAEREAQPFLDRVLDAVPGTPQRHRYRWSLPTLRRSSGPVTAGQTTDFQPTPIAATNGRSATVTRRTQSMFSPVKAIAAGALVFAIGGALFLAQPFDQRGAVTPGAEAEYAQLAEVTGTLESGECDTPDHRGEGSQDVLPGAHTLWTCIGPATASDPRLTGTSTYLADWQWFRGNGLDASDRLTAGCDADDECILPQFGLAHSARSIENDGGIWRQRPFVQVESSAGMDYGEQNPVIHVFDGEGTYEGLVAVLEVSGDSEYDFSDASHDFWGYILDARQLRDAPENASVE